MDPGDPSTAHQHPHFWSAALPPPLVCHVVAGEVLYLPAGWWHHVTQVAQGEEPVVAVNYWYDMRFHARSALVGLVEGLARKEGLSEAPVEEGE